MPKNLFQPGNKIALGHHSGRPQLDVVSLSDRGAVAVLQRDLNTLHKADENPKSVPKLEVHRAMERLSRMCKGRIPVRIAIAGDEGSEAPIPFAYITIAAAAAVALELTDGEEAEEDADELQKLLGEK